jgi:UDP-N-acetylglucosamine 2-epimerase (non-hydrolysing)
VTLHRPSNVDEPATLQTLVDALGKLGNTLPLVFPVHPRTRRQLNELGTKSDKDLTLIGPLGYVEFLALQKHAAFVVTDSGGVQEETTFLQVPCLTIRPNTERPITLSQGSNTLVGGDLSRLQEEAQRAFDGRGKTGRVPQLWDGHAAERIAEVILRLG